MSNAGTLRVAALEPGDTGGMTAETPPMTYQLRYIGATEDIAELPSMRTLVGGISARLIILMSLSQLLSGNRTEGIVYDFSYPAYLSCC